MIKTEHLSKRYDTLTAVDDVSFEVKPGEVLGFLGPNGAGKTTTMRMLAGFITPTGGKASICGHDVETDAARRQSEPRLPARRRAAVRRDDGACASSSSSRTCASSSGEPRKRAARLRHRAPAARAACSTQSIETLSKGFRRRVGLAQALIHDPPVLILDEPTDGLDPNQKHEVRTLINEMARDKIIVISTHILEEVDAVCTRAIIIARGTIVADDTPQGLATKSRYHNAVSLKLEQRGSARRRARGRSRRAAVRGGSGSERARDAPHRPAARGRLRSSTR